MSDNLLTLDNPPLSGLKKSELAHIREINCTGQLSDAAKSIIRQGLSEATRKAYLADLAHFERAGGRIPSTPAYIAEYLAANAGSLSVATLHRRVAALAKAHQTRDLSDPTDTTIVRAILRGLRRRKGVAQRQATPLVKEDLLLVLQKIGHCPRDIRDRALLLLGFAGGFRRSELIGLDCGDIRALRQGLELTVRRSKTDQEGEGRKIGIPYTNTEQCPVRAFEKWLECSGLVEGPIFRPIDRHQKTAKKRLSGAAVCDIVRKRIAAVGIDPATYTGHSLRAGFATSAARAGVSSWKIRQQTGHASDAMLGRYIRDAELFIGNAVSSVL